MNKYKIIGIVLFGLGIVSFGFSLYLFFQIQNIHEVFKFYDISEDVYLENPKVRETLFNLKFGIATFIVVGLLSWLIGGYFLIKKNRNE